MSAENKFLSLVVANNVELERNWEEIGRSPQSLAQWFIKMLAVDSTKITALNEVVVSEEQPVGDSANKIWIATGPPPFIGVPDGNNGYARFYQYPANTPFLWVLGESNLPQWIERVSTNELSSYGLTEPTSDQYFYAILRV